MPVNILGMKPEYGLGPCLSSCNEIPLLAQALHFGIVHIYADK